MYTAVYSFFYVILYVTYCRPSAAICYPLYFFLTIREPCRVVFNYNKQFNEARMNALQKQSLAEWKDKSSNKFTAMRAAMKEGKTLGAWKEVRIFVYA